MDGIRDNRRFGVGDASAILAGVLWGGELSVTKWVLQSIPEGQFLTLRFGAAAIVFGLLLTRQEAGDGKRMDIRALLALGILGVGVYNVLFTMGIHRTSASTAALIISTSPLITGVWCALTGRERLSGRRCAGTLLAFLGVLLVLASGGNGLSPFGRTVRGKRHYRLRGLSSRSTRLSRGRCWPSARPSA